MIIIDCGTWNVNPKQGYMMYYGSFFYWSFAQAKSGKLFTDCLTLKLPDCIGSYPSGSL